MVMVLVVALGIVGIASALALPAISNLMPDTNKLKVVEYYNLISKINEEMLSSINVYYPIKEISIDSDGRYKYTYKCYGLSCENPPSKLPSGYSVYDFQGNTKYRKLFYLTKGETSLDSDALTTSDGSHWTITRKELGKYTITIDLDGLGKGKNCKFSNTCNKNVDTYIFEVDEDGNVEPADVLSRAYLENSSDMNSRKKDYARAKELLNLKEAIFAF